MILLHLLKSKKSNSYLIFVLCELIKIVTNQVGSHGIFLWIFAKTLFIIKNSNHGISNFVLRIFSSLRNRKNYGNFVSFFAEIFLIFFWPRFGWLSKCLWHISSFVYRWFTKNEKKMFQYQEGKFHGSANRETSYLAIVFIFISALLSSPNRMLSSLSSLETLWLFK